MRRSVSLDVSAALLLLTVLLTAGNDSYYTSAQDLEVCGTYACCIDCLCCGPGTGWDGVSSCVAEELLGGIDSGPCGVLEILETEGCVAQTSCEGDDCCGEGTFSAVDPTREAEACYCVTDDIARTEPPVTRGPRPTEAPTSVPSLMPIETRDPATRATRDPATRVP